LAGAFLLRYVLITDSLSLPGIKSKQQPATSAVQPTNAITRQHAAAAAAAQYSAGALQKQKQYAQPSQQLPSPGKAPGSLSNLAAAAAAAMQQHRQQQQPFLQAAPQQPQQQLQHPAQLLNSSNSIQQASRRIRSNRTTASSFATRLRGQQQQWQEEVPEEDPFLAQRRLHQLPGLEGVCSGQLEAAAGRRIMALPHIICRAADGNLYRMKTG
jgi:hypothetical protein